MTGAKVLVLGEDTRSFLTVIRSLGKAGHVVDAVCYDNNSPSIHSIYINHLYLLNYQAYEQQDWLEQVIQICRDNLYDAVIPCDERAIFPLAEHADKFPDTCKLGIPNHEVLQHLFDKESTKALALSCQVPVAKGERLAIKALGYDKLLNKFGANFVVKPTLSFTSSNLATRQKVEIIYTQADFERYTQYLSEQDECLVEEYFTGVGEGLSIFAVKGKIQHAFAHTRVNEPRTGGGSSYRKAIPVDPAMLAACQDICTATNYDGVGMFEFKKNMRSKEWILVEVNARFWGSLPLAVFAGIDFPLHYVQHLLGRYHCHPGVDTNYKTEAYARSLSNDLYDIKAEFEYDKNNQGALSGLATLCKRASTFTRLLRHETIDSYDRQDPKPFYAECRSFYADTLGAKVQSRIRVARDQEMIRLLRAIYVQQQPTIHFVCYGNIMRSPFAEACMRVLSKEYQLDWQIQSFGFHQNQNRASPTECITCASQLGLDLGPHRSRCLRQKHLQAQDIIFIFDTKNQVLLNRYYQYQHCFNLAHFIPSGMGYYNEIVDPYGSGEKAVKHCYKLITEAIKQILESHTRMLSQ